MAWMEERPNPQPLPYKGRGARCKASLLLGYGVHTSLLDLPPRLLIPPTPLFKAGLFHSLRLVFCQEYQPEILVSRQSKNYCFKQEI
ncbi:hypothetical protein NIES25_23820 [Nostoc linckia NIES-25]|nr:hypothetical protein NIES25_23820 [Nostoc linckia NIES-25]